MPALAPPRSVYLHVPFCPHVCPYCDFHKMRRDESLVAAYLDRLEGEIRAAGERWGGRLDTLYLGGGTPSHLSDAELERVFAALDEAFGLPARLETTLEADPATFDRARLERFRALGVSRLSIGLQSGHDPVLRFLGRVHDARQGLEAVRSAQEAGFEVSADLITAVPGQDAVADLRRVAEIGVGHISVYTLTIEPYTPFALRRIEVDEDRAAEDFESASDVLAGYGYHRYEVSNHALPGRESVHNQVYWHGATFLGLGPSAAGYLPANGDGSADLGVRVANPPIKAWLRRDPPERRPLEPRDFVLERLMTGLRTTRGVDLSELEARSGVRVRERYAQVVEEELAAGRLELNAGRLELDGGSAGQVLRATPDGLRVLDAILRRFFAA